MLHDIKGRRALVTGSSTGIGAAVALELGRLGARVAVHGNANADAALAVAGRINADGGEALTLLGDVAEPDEARRVVAEAVQGLGGLDILVNNAGAMIKRTTNAEPDLEVCQSVLDLNVKSILVVTAAAYPHLKAAGGGAIINTGSIAGRFGGFLGSTIYAASKAAVHSISRNAAREFALDNIRVNTVAPGFILTPFHERTPESVREAARMQIPTQRLGSAEDCVGAYIFLASASMSGYVTGQIIDVNGGQLMP